MTKFKRVLLKLSGESLSGGAAFGIDEKRLMEYVSQVKEICQLNVQVGIVIGGGNIFRGLKGVDRGFDRVKGDYMGMLATTINSLALQSGLESINQPARLLTSFGMEPVGERYSVDKAMKAFKDGEVVIISGGTGNPFFTTDSASALRAIEIKADVLLKGTRVDGVYSADPEKDPNARKFDKITFDEVIDRELNVMDLTAFTLCKENNMPIIVFDMNKIDNLKKVVIGTQVGTIVS